MTLEQVDTRTPWQRGDVFWRGFARTYDGGVSWHPEIRSGKVCETNHDGTFKAEMVGPMPRAFGRANGGAWYAFNLDPALMCETPEAALVQALAAVANKL